MAVRRQHYVWRHYLEAWQARDGLVSSLVGDKFVRTNPSNIMVERDFYRLHAITRRDVAMLRELLLREETPSALRRSHENLVAQFTRVSDVQEAVQGHPKVPSHAKASVRDMAIQIEERIHGGTEDAALPILRALRNKDRSVLHSDAAAFAFFNFVSQQYMRTKPTRDRIEAVLTEIMSPASAERIRHVYCHCIATNLGASLYVDRQEFELLFFDAPADQGLITGDQPLVNMLHTDDGNPPPEMVLYYPLSPILGMILAPKSFAMGPAVRV